MECQGLTYTIEIITVAERKINGGRNHPKTVMYTSCSFSSYREIQIRNTPPERINGILMSNSIECDNKNETAES